MDVDKLHTIITDLHQTQDNIAHSLEQQVTYFRRLGETVTIDHAALVNLSATIKNFAENTKSTFQEVSSKFELGNKLRETAAEIRKLEFALFRLESYVNGYMVGLQVAMQGQIPINVITPTIVRGILTNITPNFPEGYALIAEAGPLSLRWYYEFIKVTLMTNSQGFRLVLSILIKNLWRKYELYRLYVLPFEIVTKIFLKFNIEKEYLAIHAFQHTYALLSEKEIMPWDRTENPRSKSTRI
jgi:hypothetical protein